MKSTVLDDVFEDVVVHRDIGGQIERCPAVEPDASVYFRHKGVRGQRPARLMNTIGQGAIARIRIALGMKECCRGQ